MNYMIFPTYVVKGRSKCANKGQKTHNHLFVHDAQGKWHKHLSVPVLHQSQAHMLSLSTDSIPHLHAMVHAHQNGLMYVKMMVSIIKCNEMCLHCFISESIIQSASLFEQVGSWRSSYAILVFTYMYQNWLFLPLSYWITSMVPCSMQWYPFSLTGLWNIFTVSPCSTKMPQRSGKHIQLWSCTLRTQQMCWKKNM